MSGPPSKALGFLRGAARGAICGALRMFHYREALTGSYRISNELPSVEAYQTKLPDQATRAKSPRDSERAGSCQPLKTRN